MTATGKQIEALGRALCAFSDTDPDDIISDAGHTALDWVMHYDVPRVAALMSVELLPSEAESSVQFPATLGI